MKRTSESIHDFPGSWCKVIKTGVIWCKLGCLLEFRHLHPGHFVSGVKDQNFCKAKCYNSLISAKQELSQEIEHHSLKVAISFWQHFTKSCILFLRDRWSFVLFCFEKTRCCLPLCCVKWKDCCWHKGQPCCECCILFFIVSLKVFYFPPLPTS